MKKTISVLLAILLVMSIAVMPVFAQGSATGDEWQLTITRGSSTHEEIQQHLDAAAANPCTPEEGYSKVDEFDVSWYRNPTGQQEEYKYDAANITININLDGKDWYVMHLEKDEEWVKVSGCSYSGGVLTIPAPSLSVFAVYAKTSSGSGSGGGSPATGDNSAYFVLMAVVFAALAVVFVKKAVKNN